MLRRAITNILAGFKQSMRMADRYVCHVEDSSTQRTQTVCGMRGFVRIDAKKIIRFES